MEHPRILALFGGAVLFGQERGNIEALVALKGEGCEVLSLIRDDSWSIHIPPALDARGLKWVKVPYIEHRMPGRLHYMLLRNPIAFLRANWGFLSIAREFRPTHIHAFNPLYVLNFLIGLLLIRKPMVYRSGDQPILHNWVWRALWRFVVRRVDQFVANSRFVAKKLVETGVSDDQVTVIYNLPVKRTYIDDFPKSFDVPSNKLKIGFVGQLTEEKGPHLLIEAFRIIAQHHDQVHLLIAGRVSDWKGDEWARQLRDGVVHDALIESRVTFLGYVENIPALLDVCDILIVPSLMQDPAPNVVMEAKQAGCPAIVFPRGGMPEMIEHSVDGLVCSEASVTSLVAALKIYIDNPDLIIRHGKAALASLERLGTPEFARRWLDVYGSAVR